MRDPEASRSLRRLLLGWLIGPLLFLIVVASMFSYLVATRATNGAYDRSLLDPVLAFAQNVKVENGAARLDLPQRAQEVLLVDESDRLYYQILGPKGELVAGVSGLPRPELMPPVNKPLFYDGAYLGQPVRVAALQIEGGVLIQTAETLVKRNREVWEILAGELLPSILVALAAILVVWFGVRRGLAPLERLREQIAARTPRDLSAMEQTRVPAEVQPVVAALNRLLQRLQEANEAQHRFLADAAHQLRTPLAGLRMQLELANRQGMSESELKEAIASMLRATERAGHLANQLLALARADSASQVRALKPVDLQDVAKDIMRGWVHRAFARGIDLGFELEPAMTQGDAFLLGELLTNLIDNAVKYTPPGGRVTVRTRTEPGCAVLEVEDSGLGIAPEERQRIFERFYRAQGMAGEGAGLGLAIVSEIARLHGAKLEVLDPAVGGGTLMRVRF
jgi:two-component system sensor histidine kinase TctE